MRGGGRAVPLDDVHQEPRTAAGDGRGGGPAQGSGQGSQASPDASAVHFTVNGEPLEAWAPNKSQRPFDERPRPNGGSNQPRDIVWDLFGPTVSPHIAQNKDG